MSGYRRLPGEPVDLPPGLEHGRSGAYRLHKCRCEPCLDWRRAYDRDYNGMRQEDPEKAERIRRARQDRADELREERRLAHSVVLWAYTVESTPNGLREILTVRVTVQESGYLLPHIREAIRKEAVRKFARTCPGCEIGRQGWAKEVIHLDDLKEKS